MYERLIFESLSVVLIYNFNIISSSTNMFLGKYENKKRLGKGAYGDVYLVEDDKGTQYALKLISVKMI